MKDELVGGMLERLTPASGEVELDWQDVLDRAGIGRVAGLDRPTAVAAVRLRRRVDRRRLAVALAVLAAAGGILVATPVGAAIANGIGDFSTWLTGSPGEPASPAEQRAFDRATRSWTGFPPGTRLRRLAETRAAGATFTLYGFRGAGSLCLRLVVTGAESERKLSCVPLWTLKARPQPALVVAADYPVGRSSRPVPRGPFPFAPPRAAVTYGIAADGVQRLELGRSEGATVEALVSGNAFLAVETEPSFAERVTRVWASAGDRRVAIPFVVAPTLYSWSQTTGPTLRAHGPASVQRVVHGGAVRWLARREPRGEPVPRTVHHIAGVLPDVVFHHEIAPDPAAPERMVVSVRPAHGAYFHGRLRNDRQVCAELVGGRFGGGGCWPAGRLFSTAPFALGVTQDNQYVTIAGLASDDVARLALYLGTGTRVAVPLHDNGYLVQAALADYPVRLVGYDSRGLVIGVKTLKGDLSGPPRAQPAANARWRRVVRNGAGEVFVARSTTGGTCYAIRLSSGGAMLGCPPPLAADGLEAGTSSNGEHVWLTGRAGSAIARVVVRFDDGRTQTVVPSKGYVVALLPSAHAAFGSSSGIGSIAAFDARGRVVARQRR